MANKFIKYLTQGLVGGFLNPKGLMGNWQHASRVFVDDTFRLSPRTKFLFYVHFELDKTAMSAPAFTNRHADEMGVLVKAADLPKFNFDSVVKNQYNRKKILYKQINYEPVNITFHDDTQGIINALWAIYYGTYIQDRNNPTSAYSATHYRSSTDPLNAMRYGMDRNKVGDIFKSISIYTMSRSRFNGYTLVNPRIKSWQHGNVDYSAADTIESSMTLEYESVFYTQGTVSRGTPKGFANLHYDTTPSPLSIAGGGVSNLLGEGGVLSGLESVFGAVGSGSAFGSFGGFLGTAISAVNTVKNIKSLSKAGLAAEAINVLSSPSSISTIGGVIGSVFPKNQASDGKTPASQKTLIG
jgi:hypothetical protein